MKKKVALFLSMLALLLVFLLGVSTIQKIQSNDLDTKTTILDKDGNQIESVTEDTIIYGE
ncbi:MAG: hypothetical protein L0L95_06270 [Staphylococcus equorum]|nr:hypothetical protein [Lactococcus lactis]MDN6290622.1 hypothetical protein [Tetragenococcus koreensis]MDN6735695.1 hypothetical protein [Tetragenococcus koreensis]MDN6749838.1 hypothetical protein [Staphylococcus equorum]